MSLNLHTLNYDPSVPTEGQRVGSFLIGAGGTVITETGTALDVNIASSDIDIQVDLDLSNFVADDAPDTENPLKVGTRAKDGLLAAISASDDKADMISDMYRRLWVNNAPNVGWAVTQEAVAAVAAQKLAVPTPGRQRLLVQNQGDKSIWIGETVAVAVGDGFEVPKYSTLEIPFGEDLDIFAISTSGTQDVRWVELG